MTQAYFIIPGLLRESKEALDATDPTVVAALNALLKGAEPPAEQTLVPTHLSGSTHLAWSWRVLTRSNETFATAPYRWAMLGGPRFAGEIWRLSILRKDEKGRIAGFFSGNEKASEAISVALRGELQKEGFTLQRWDSSFFLTRKKPWRLTAREAETLVGTLPTEADLQNSETNTTATEAYAEVEKLNEILAGLSIPGADALWIDGGGLLQDFYPPTQIRSVLADDAAILGWADAAGILCHRVAKATGATNWPADAPNGAVLAVFSDLLKAAHQGGASEYNKAILSLCTQIATLKEAARKRGCEEALIVACGKRKTKTFSVKLTNPKSLLARFAPTKKIDLATWLYEESD